MVRLDCIERPLSRLFYHYGKFVARHPFVFLILPLVGAGILASGFYKLSINTDLEYLYTPENGRAKTERNNVVELFPQNSSHEFDAMRATNSGKYIRVIVTARGGGSVLHDDIYDDIVQLDKDMNGGLLRQNYDNITYADVCARILNDECANNNLLLSLTTGLNISVSSLDLTYPLSEINVDLRTVSPASIPHIKEHKMNVFIGSSLGGVTLGNESHVLSARAMQLVYYFRDDTEETKKQSAKWIAQTATELLANSYPKINISLITSETLEESVVDTTLSVIPLFVITFTVLILFSILSCMMMNWVTSKPLLGLTGVLSAGLAVISTFGLLSYIGIDFIEIVATTPFLILAIGVDGMFVMLASWRLTDVKSGYVERTGVTFSEAGLSVLITSLTDGLAFAVGSVTFYPSVRTFCLYTGVAVLFDFIFQITFFGAVMALTGKREEQSRHCLIFCMRMAEKCDTQSSRDHQHGVMAFFRMKYGPVITKPVAKIVVIAVFIAYLAVAIHSCVGAQEGIKMKNLAQDGSYAVKFYDQEAEFFQDYGPAVSVVIKGNLDIQAEADVDGVKRLLKKFTDNIFFGEENETVSWLRDFEIYTDRYNLSRDMHTLLNRFLNEPAFQEHSKDIVVENNTITACRFFVRAVGMYNAELQRDMMITARDIAEGSHMQVTVYNPVFLFYDQYVTVVKNTMQNIAIATGSMLLVSLLLIPNPACVVWVFLSICSICTGVVGYMTLWGVDFDSIAMINLIMCIGFCVDFCAHITYVYSVSKNEEPSQRVSDALGYLGYPIMQGGLSTILGIVPLAFASAYTIRTFFKIIFLVIVISAFHGLVVLPVLLSLTGRQKAQNPDTKGTCKLSVFAIGATSTVHPLSDKPSLETTFCANTSTDEKTKGQEMVRPPPYKETPECDRND